jgi:flagella basal body P-ring formation protein FlgA
MTHIKRHNFLLISLVVVLFSTRSIAANDYQSLSAIQDTVVHFIEANIDTSQDYAIHVNKLDSRLKLPKCTIPLEAYSNNDRFDAGVLSIGVRCNGQQKWALYNSAKLTFYQQVLVLKRSLKRNSLVDADNVVLKKYPSTKIRRGYFTQYQQIKNQLTTRNIRAGTILQPAHLSTPKLIKKGQQVIIHASSSAISIKMPGRALMDGSLGQQIRIKNSKSKKIIEGTVVKAGIVSVNF